MFESLTKTFTSLFGRSSSAQQFHPDATCPECGSRLWSPPGENAWTCPNLDCPIQIRKRLQHWCSPDAMDIPEATPAVVAQLLKKGLARDVAELYRMKPAEIAALEGMDAHASKQLFESIASTRNRDAWRLLFGLSISHLQSSEAQALCRKFGSVDNVFAASTDRLVQTPAVSESAARSITEWHSDGVNRRLVRRLFKAGLNFKA